MSSGAYAQWLATENRSRGFQGRVAPLVAGRLFMPSSSLDSSADLYVPMRIHRKMPLGRKSVRPDDLLRGNFLVLDIDARPVICFLKKFLVIIFA
ncbi:MAG: hypothetical protein NTV82_03550 [Candidatus Aminicenantes bacterium]|nr:hypothetical protein [Candidatus Aminicenantes bacterium]